VGIDAKEMLQAYQAPVPGSKIKKATRGHISPRPPQTLAELIALYDVPNVRFSGKQDEEIEACQAALLAESISGTEKM
jgi:hypothetical protein